MNPDRPLVVYVDVDDTLVRSVGTKSVPIPGVVEQVKKLASATVHPLNASGKSVDEYRALLDGGQPRHS